MITDEQYHCERCGKRHLAKFVYLELDTVTHRYYEPGTVPVERSQGLFRFGPACAKTTLKETNRASE
jgi:late competence protein required for DNA uptake (superfamily II DNA/RNA helicase)